MCIFGMVNCAVKVNTHVYSIPLYVYCILKVVPLSKIKILSNVIHNSKTMTSFSFRAPIFEKRGSFGLSSKPITACYIISDSFHIKTKLLPFSIQYRIPSKYSALLITASLHFLALRNIVKQWQIQDFPWGALTR